MAQTIKLKRSSVQNNVPSTSDLELGELAINTHDGKLFIKKDDGSASIVQVGGIVGTSELTDGSVTTSKIANDAVNADKLADNSVGIAALNVSDGTNGQVLTTNGSGTLSFTTVSGGSGQANQNAFSNVAVPGQTTIAADGTTDTLNLAAGSGIQLTTNAGTDTLTITSTATGSVTEAFKNIAVSGQSNVVADSATDTLTFVAGNNMTITTNASNDTVTFASSGSGSGTTGSIDSQIFNGDGTDTTFTLSNSASTEDNLWVFVDGVYQNKDSYSVSGTTLTMADAPDNGTKLAVHHVRVGVPANGSITAAQLASPLSLSGDFAVDTNVLKVDASNNRVGINVTTPSHPLDVVGNTNITGEAYVSSQIGIGTTSPGTPLHIVASDPKIKLQDSDGTNQFATIFQSAGSLVVQSRNNTSKGNITFQGHNGSAATQYGRFNAFGHFVIGTGAPSYSLHVNSTDAILVPVGTTAQRPTAAEGLFRYNSDDDKFEGYTASGWGAIAGSGGSSGSSSNFLVQELTGDGTTTAFTLQKTVTSEDNLIVFNEGVFQRQDSYAASGTTITFDTAPASSNKIVVYQMETGVVGVAPKIDTMTGDGSDTTLTLSVAPASENQTIVNIDGVTQHKATYSVSGTTLTFSSPPPNGSAVECITLTNMSVTTIGDDDLDTKIHFDETADDDVIRFDTAGTERMVIGGTGKVGIGVASPSGKLHLKTETDSGYTHGLVVERNNATDKGYINYQGGAFRMVATDGDPIKFGHASNNNRFEIGASGDAVFSGGLTVTGNFTVNGTTTTLNSTSLTIDDKKITVAEGAGSSSAADEAGIEVGVGAVGASSNPSILYNHANTTWKFNKPVDVSLIRADTLNNRANSANIIYRTSTNTIVGNNASALVVQDGGNVGIGTTSPSSKLEIFNSSVSGNTQLHIHNDKSGDAAVLKLEGKRSSINDTGQLLFANNSNLVAKIDARSAGDDGELRFFTSPSSSGSTLTERMVIKSGGDVGIGTTSVLSGVKLDVRSGNIHVGAFGATGSKFGLRYSSDDGSSHWYTYSATGGELVFGRSGVIGDAEKVRFDASGNVGIGTNNPQNPLEISTTNKLGNSFTGGTDGEGIRITQTNYTAGNHVSLIEASYDDASSTPDARIGVMFNGSGSTLKFGTSDNYGTGITNTAMSINHNGYVGIGTDDPAVELDIKKVANNYPLRIGSEQGSGRAMVFADVATTPNKYNWLVGAQYTVNNGFEITPSTAVGGYTFSNPGIVVLETGNVGIGTTSPTYKLDVAGDIGVNEYIYHNDDTNTYMRFQTDKWLVRTGGDDRIIVSGGNVGIGVGNPSYKLHVSSKLVVGDSPAGLSGNTIFVRENSSSGIHFPLVIGGGTHSAGAAFGLGFDPEGYGNRNKMAILAEGIGTGYSRGRLHFALDANNNGDQAALADSKMCITESGKIGIGNQLDSPHGRLHVKGASTNEGQVHETTTCKEYRNVATAWTTGSTNRYWHIKTSISTGVNVMFVGHVEGYAYGASGHIVDVKRSGYMYSPSAAVINSQTINNGSGSATLNVYNSSDGYMVFVCDFGGGYYSGGAFHIQFPSPAGHATNFSVLAQVMNTTSTGHY